MKLYTLTYDDARPTKQQVNIPTNSDYKIGIKVIGSKDAGKIVKWGVYSEDATVLAEAFNLYPQQVTLVGDDGSTISADPELTNGYVTFTLKAGDEAKFTKYKVQVKNDTFDGIQYSPVAEGTLPSHRLTTRSTTISCDNPTTIYPSDKLQLIGEDGKIYPAYGNGNIELFHFTVKDTQLRPESTLSYYMFPYRIGYYDGYVVGKNTFAQSDDNSINGYNIAPKFTGEMISAGYSGTISYSRQVKGHYYLQFAVIPYENTFDLAINTFKSQQGDIGDNPADMATTEYVDNAVSAKVSGSSVGQAPAILSAASVYASDWATLSSTANENTMYVVLPDPVLLTRVKYTTDSGLPDWEGDIVGELIGEEDQGEYEPTTQIPNVKQAEEIIVGSNAQIGDGALASCPHLTKVTIPGNATVIGDSAFWNDTSLSNVTIPEGVTTLDSSAFVFCSSLTSITIPASVTTIGSWAFGDSGVMDITFSGKTKATVQGMTDYNWSLPSGCVIHCTDGDITIS